MNQNYSRDQFSNVEYFQPTFTNLTSQPSPGQVGNSIVNPPYINSALNDTNYHSSNGCPTVHATAVQPSQPHQTLQSTSVDTTSNSYVVQSSANPLQAVRLITFFYQPPNDFFIYRITTKEISLVVATQLLSEFNGNINSYQNKYVFYQQIVNNRVYQVECEIVLPSLIINFLNKSIFGIETYESNIEQELPTFTFNQKENLRFYLTQYLGRYLWKQL